MKLLNIYGTTIDLEQIEIAHLIPGRIRLRTRQLKHNPEMADSIQKSVSDISFIQKCEINRKTGSILLIYDQSKMHELKEWAQQISSSGILPEGWGLDDLYEMAINHSNHHTKSISGEIRTAFRGFNNQLKKTSGGVMGLNDAFPILLFSLGMKRLITAERLTFPEWYTYLWFAFTSYFILNPNEKQNDKRAK
ncbi:MAG TPA: hypothetical protein VKA34_16555 [Balneolales bacterium]|nr:hypothetical protein [Balneolales bacterium]